MTLITGMLISGKMSVAMLSSANGVASTISIAITMNVYGRFSASSTIDTETCLRELRNSAGYRLTGYKTTGGHPRQTESVRGSLLATPRPIWCINCCQMLRRGERRASAFAQPSMRRNRLQYAHRSRDTGRGSIGLSAPLPVTKSSNAVISTASSASSSARCAGITTTPSPSPTITSPGNTGASPQPIGTLMSSAWCSVRLVGADGRLW